MTAPGVSYNLLLQRGVGPKAERNNVTGVWQRCRSEIGKVYYVDFCN